MTLKSLIDRFFHKDPKTSEVIAEARTYLWYPYTRGGYEFTCNTILSALDCSFEVNKRMKYIEKYQELLPEDVIQNGMKNVDVFTDYSCEEMQEFRFLFMCIAEEYFKSIED